MTNRRLCYLPDVTRFDEQAIARDYGAAALQTCDVNKALALRALAPSMQIWYITVPQGVRDEQPWLLEPVAQATDPMARMVRAVKENAAHGVDWLIRDAHGAPVRMCPNISLGNATMACPRGKWDWTWGMTFLQAALAAYRAVIADGRWSAAYRDHVAFEMGGCLASSVALPGKTGPCSAPDHGGPLSSRLIQAWGQFYTTFRREFPSLRVMFNAPGKDPMLGLWTPDAYKVERVGNQQGQARTAYQYAAIIAALPKASVLHIAPDPGWDAERKARHVRLWSAIGVMFDLWIDVGDYDGGGYHLTREEAPEHWRWSEWTPTGPMIQSLGLCIRQFREGKLVANVGTYEMSGVPMEDAVEF